MITAGPATHQPVQDKNVIQSRLADIHSQLIILAQL